MPVPISRRLLCCAAMVPFGARVADIGADHGYLGIHLLEQGVVSYVAACDLRPGPLDSARRNAALFGCADQVRKDMKQLNPEFFKLDKISQQLDANTIILPNYSAAAMNGTHRISHAIAQREAQARRSSGGGGFSSWGGGGGFSGGGGGGGVR